MHSWCPEDDNTGEAEWDRLSVRERAGVFVYKLCYCVISSKAEGLIFRLCIYSWFSWATFGACQAIVYGLDAS